MAIACDLAVLHGNDRKIIAAGDAIAARPDIGQRGLPLGVDGEATGDDRQRFGDGRRAHRRTSGRLP